MKRMTEKLEAVHTHTHTHTHTSNNLKEEKRVDKIYFKSAMQKNIDRLLFSKQKLAVSNLKNLQLINCVY